MWKSATPTSALPSICATNTFANHWRKFFNFQMHSSFTCNMSPHVRPHRHLTLPSTQPTTTAQTGRHRINLITAIDKRRLSAWMTFHTAQFATKYVVLQSPLCEPHASGSFLVVVYYYSHRTGCCSLFFMFVVGRSSVARCPVVPASGRQFGLLLTALRLSGAKPTRLFSLVVSRYTKKHEAV